MLAARRYVCTTCGEVTHVAGVCTRDGVALADAGDDALIGEDVVGYRIVELIGRGGMGRVYRGLQRAIGAQVAIKVLNASNDPEIAERFVAEARVPNLVRHDGLVDIIGLGVLPDGRPYQLMEYLAGGSLADVFAQHRKIPLGTLCELVGDALRALDALHGAGVVHRDVKPSNLFVTTGGRLVVLDFGIAKLVEPGGRNLTRTGQAMGTPEYMAPEQAESASVDARADLYSLGVVLFEGATGKRPFGGRLIEALALRELPPHVHPPELDAIVRTAMEPDPARRYATATAMARAIDDFVATLPTEAFGSLELAPAEPAPTALTVREPVDAPRLGRYSIEGTLGRGGAGTVLVGHDDTVGRKVALKLLDVSAGRRERLVREARAMAKVNHPNVRALYELGDDGDMTFLALEYVDGSDLVGWLAEPRTTREIIDVFVAAGRGLAAAHAAGVVHRDFKPANVLVGSDGRPRVSDFGLAGEAVGGTPAYMAPEQLESGDVDARADQFAFAVALWEALHGEPPFAGTSATARALAVRRGELRAPVHDVPARCHAALRRALSAAPGDRFPALADLLDELAAPERRSRAPWLLAGAIALAALATMRFAWPTARSLDDIRALPDPGARLRALAALDDAALASPDARRMALDAAARGPTTDFDASEPITAIAFDGDRLAVATGSEIVVRDVHTREVSRLPAPGGARALHFDGARLRVLGRDGVDDRRCSTQPVGASPDLAYVACPEAGGTAIGSIHIPNDAWLGFSSDSRRGLVIASGRLEVHELATGALVGAREVGDLQGVALSGELCAIAEPSRLVIWNLATGATAEADVAGVKQLAVGGPWIAAATPTEVVLLDGSGERVMRWALDTPARGIEVIATPTVRVVIDTPGQLVVEDPARDRELVLPGGATAWVAGSPVIAVAGGTRARLWHTDLVVPDSSPSPGAMVAHSHDGRVIAYGDADSIHRVTLADRRDRAVAVTSPAAKIAFSTDDRVIAWIDRAGHALVWAPDQPPRDAGTFAPGAKALRVRDDGGVIVADPAVAACGAEPELALSERHAIVGSALCELATGRRIALPVAHPALASVDATRALVLDGDRPRLFDLDGHDIALPDVALRDAWLADGRVLGTLVDGTVAWLPEHAARAIAFDGSAGATVASVGPDLAAAIVQRELVVWDVATGRRTVIGRAATATSLWGAAPTIITTGAGVATGQTARLLVAWPIEARDAAEVRRWAAAIDD